MYLFSELHECMSMNLSRKCARWDRRVPLDKSEGVVKSKVVLGSV